jgi:hypothetical protein
VGVVGAPSSGIELVLSKNTLPLAQIRVICKNVPQVSMTNKIILLLNALKLLKLSKPEKTFPKKNSS